MEIGLTKRLGQSNLEVMERISVSIWRISLSDIKYSCMGPSASRGVGMDSVRHMPDWTLQQESHLANELLSMNKLGGRVIVCQTFLSFLHSTFFVSGLGIHFRLSI